MVKIAMLSGWHVHAKGYGKQVQEHPDAEVTVVWDDDEARGQQWAQELGVPFEADLQTTLDRDDVDAVVVDSATNTHKDVMVAAANAGKHIFTEKVLALTVAEAQEIADAVEKAGVKFIISFPHRTNPHCLFAKNMIEDGVLGDVNLVRIRNAHDGASSAWLPPHFYDAMQCGGGALMDLGAHGMYLAQWLLGNPKNITATLNTLTDKPVDDNAVAVIEFENKAIAINETGFVTPNSPFIMEVYGTEGNVLIGGPDRAIRLTSTKLRQFGVGGWVDPSNLPKALPSAMDQWLASIQGHGQIHFTMEDAIGLTALMQGAYISNETGTKVNFPIK